MTAPSLAEFLLARFADDEAAARKAGSGHNGFDWEPCERSAKVYGDGLRPISVQIGCFEPGGGVVVVDHIARHDPARVLAECEAKRRIVERLAPAVEYDRDRYIVPSSALEDAATATLRLLALPYADHPDYQRLWRP